MRKAIITSAIVFISSIAGLFAQTSPNDICQEGDCPSQVFDIQLNEPAQPGSYTKERMDKFKQAYVAFKTIKSGLSSNLDWREKYNAFQLGGTSCLRYYQLESNFGQEYLDNKDFKAWIDQEHPKEASQVAQNGFRSSRRAANLVRRMKSNCPKKVEETENRGGDPMAKTSQEYQNLGQSLGYFDKDGKTIKELARPKEYKPRRKMSKNQRIANLEDKLRQLEIGPDAKNQLDQTSQDLQRTAPRFQGLKNFISALSPLVAAFQPNPLAALSNIGKLGDLLNNLLGTKLKFPKLGLFDKMKGLFNKAKQLKGKAQDIVNQGKGIENKFNDVKKRVGQLGEDLQKQAASIGDLSNKLKALEQEKQTLLDKLADRPKRILEELENEVAQVEDKAQAIKDEIDDALNEKNKLLKKLDDLEAEKDKLEKNLKSLKTDSAALGDEIQKLEKETKEAQQELETAQKSETVLDEAAQKIETLPTKKNLEEKLQICENELKKLYDKYLPVNQTQAVLNDKMNKVKKWPGKLLDKLTNIKFFQNKLKAGENGIPPSQRVLNKLGKLTDKANTVGSILEILTGKKNKLQKRVETIDGQLAKVQNTYDGRIGKINKLKDDATALLSAKIGLQNKIDQATGVAEDMTKEANAFLEKFKIFNEESKCADLRELLDKLKELEKEQAVIEPEIEELEKKMEDNEQEQETINEETKAIEEEIGEEAKKEEELAQEEKVLSEELGEEVNIQPVEPEEWAENFEVKRDYWEAVFHPDDEVVEGYRGRYFQVNLKNAEKKIKLLFGAGKYFMKKSDFRDNYGSVIGAFVTEALHAFRKSEQGGIKLFVQGSADITGQNTFKGQLNSQFLYSEVTVLPLKENTDRFASEPKEISISEQRFTNDDLPNLRGNYLKEMISIYSKKLNPILLEGSVSDEVDKEDRNAVIYLFIPEHLVEEYNSGR